LGLVVGIGEISPAVLLLELLEAIEESGAFEARS
jgi:hypothetical protein